MERVGVLPRKITRCTFCGAKIIDGTCHCGAEGRRAREPFDGDAEDAVKAYDEANPNFKYSEEE